MVKTWDKYDNATMGVVVQNIRRCALFVEASVTGIQRYPQIDTAGLRI